MALLSTRYFNLPVLLGMTTLLCLPALFSGYLGDDYFHYALLSPDINIPKANDWSLFGLFSWIDSEPARNQALMDLGVLPWWTYEGMRYQFWRPLAEISHWLDHQLWRHHPWMMHLHSLLLYLGIGLAMARLFRQLAMPPVTALLALTIYMLDSTHGLTVSWIANRNALMATLFGLLCIQQYVVWRENGSSKAFCFSQLCLVASLLSGEIGISTAGYLGAYALILDRQGWRKGLLALWSFALVCVAWFALYKLGHFGADHSDMNYIDPVESPFAFALKALERAPVLLFAQFGIVPAEIYGFSQQPIPIFLVFAILFLGWVLLLLWPTLRRDRLARFWISGTLFALVPVTATVPADRNLLFVGIGASALLGMLMQSLFDRTIATKSQRAGVYVMIGLHLVLSPLLLPIFSYSPQLWSNLMGLPLARQLPVTSSSESLLSFGVPMPVSMGAIPMRFAEDLPIPEKMWTISTLQQNFSITRLNENTLLVHSEKGMVQDLEANLRNLTQFPIRAHEKVVLTDLTLEVVKLNENGHPTDLLLTFNDDRLESTSILFWNGKSFERRQHPELGQTLELTLGEQPVLASSVSAD